MGWKKIETAPKDGAEIILASGNVSFSGYWESSPNYWGEVGWHEEDARQGHFYHRHPMKPTSWMPLPKPPQIMSKQYDDESHCSQCQSQDISYLIWATYIGSGNWDVDAEYITSVCNNCAARDAVDHEQVRKAV